MTRSRLFASVLAGVLLTACAPENTGGPSANLAEPQPVADDWALPEEWVVWSVGDAWLIPVPESWSPALSGGCVVFAATAVSCGQAGERIEIELAPSPDGCEQGACAALAVADGHLQLRAAGDFTISPLEHFRSVAPPDMANIRSTTDEWPSLFEDAEGTTAVRLCQPQQRDPCGNPDPEQCATSARHPVCSIEGGVVAVVVSGLVTINEIEQILSASSPAS